ncbi:cryptococcal mannosyltransferase 1-domain-containing protein [Lasiosphaeria hispida]|uniref:Cryptococcal mannosyltransferase 1-domain-containing protein n=1 Tax=Lasiosphaeria hispida TaxID=260671 RepID=A0AAJ0MCX1_9PEZI|nr:cryptococcal mannosyltransferase 1-domain-containing protein [Lasiosphaeria hispida]
MTPPIAACCGRWRLVRQRRLIFYLIFYVLLVFALTPIFIPSYTRLPAHYQTLNEKCDGPSPKTTCANPHREKVFIAAILYDENGTLAGGIWGRRVLALINLLGPENVFLSIYENDSGARGQAALAAFKQLVPCPNHIVSEEHLPLTGFYNITFPNGSQRTKRVAYLSELRNRALRPLDDFREDRDIVKFDKVLFLNDAAFEPMDAAHLLFNTNQGPDGRASYVAACAVDWFHPFRTYDVYALRDAEGYANYQTLFPFFGKRGGAISRTGVLRQSDAVRVKSCWGGMMAMQAEYIQNLNKYLPSPAFGTVNGHVIDPDYPRNVTAPVRFRYEPGVFYDACECCLFSADLEQVARQDGAVETGIYANPFVRVAYTEEVLRWLPYVKRWERLFVLAFTFQSWFTPAAENPYRTVQEGEPFTEEIWDGEEWRLVSRVGRNGMFCGIRDMQVLRKEGAKPGKLSYNWVNTRRPPGQTLQFRSWWGPELSANWREEYMATAPAERDAFFEFE